MGRQCVYYQFLMVDSPLVFQGRRNFFLKMGLDGDLIRGIDTDTWGPGEFLEGSLGLWHKGRFYLTYVGKNDNLPSGPRVYSTFRRSRLTFRLSPRVCTSSRSGLRACGGSWARRWW